MKNQNCDTLLTFLTIENKKIFSKLKKNSKN